MTGHGPKRKVASSLVALSSAAIMAVYAAGYVRTRRAAERFDLEATARKRPTAPARAARPATPLPARAVPSLTPAPAASPAPTLQAPRGGVPPPDPSPAASPSATAVHTPPAAPTPTRPAPPVQSTPGPSATPIDRPRVSPTPTPVPAAQATPAVPAPAPAPSVQPTTAVFEEPMEGDEVGEAAARPSDQYKDGTFTGWGTCRHGDIQVELVIRAGRIAWASIAKCYTRYPCNMLDRLAPEVIGQQGPPVTFVSGASESSDAFYYAVLDALSKAK